MGKKKRVLNHKAKDLKKKHKKAVEDLKKGKPSKIIVKMHAKKHKKKNH